MTETQEINPWPAAQEGVFGVIRAWAHEERDCDPEASVEEIANIMTELNKTEGAPFVFVCELGRMTAMLIARYMTALNEEVPTRAQIMAELDVLEMEYIEETVMAEEE